MRTAWPPDTRPGCGSPGHHVAEKDPIDSSKDAWLARLIRLGGEIALVGALFALYKAGRLVTDDARDTALANASNVLRWEQAVGLPNELWVQQTMLSSETLTRLANAYYASVHFPLTAAFLIWLYMARRRAYVQARNVLILMTALALILHIVYPLAPTRMLDEAGFVDTGAMLGPSVYDSPADSVSNQFAAMPSLHFGWALVVAYGCVRVLDSRVRWLALVHPIITLLVIVGTGNHFWIDAVVAGLLFVLAVVIVRSVAERHRVGLPGPMVPVPGSARVEDRRCRRPTRGDASASTSSRSAKRTRRCGWPTSTSPFVTHAACASGTDACCAISRESSSRSTATCWSFSACCQTRRRLTDCSSRTSGNRTRSSTD